MQHVLPDSSYFTFKIPQYMPCYSKTVLFALFSLNLKYSKCEAPYHFLTKTCIRTAVSYQGNCAGFSQLAFTFFEHR